PRVMVSNPDFQNSLTVSNASSAHYTLAFMSVVALIFIPIVLLYQAWTYHVFRHRVGGDVPRVAPAADGRGVAEEPPSGYSAGLNPWPTERSGSGSRATRRLSSRRPASRRRQMRALDPRLVRRARAVRVLLAVDVALGLATTLLVLFQATLLARILTRGFHGEPLRAVAPELVLLAGAFALRGLTSWGFEAAGGRAAADVL